MNPPLKSQFILYGGWIRHKYSSNDLKIFDPIYQLTSIKRKQPILFTSLPAKTETQPRFSKVYPEVSTTRLSSQIFPAINISESVQDLEVFKQANIWELFMNTIFSN